MKQIHTEAWVRFYDLPQEYWRPKTLFEILAVVGTLITLADSMRRKAFKHILCKAFGGCRFSWNPLGRSDGGASKRFANFLQVLGNLVEDISDYNSKKPNKDRANQLKLVISKSNKKKMKKNENPSISSVSTKPHIKGGSLKSA
ncbi:hypothetical protein JHK82_039446 [Glycine max]|nr:hypothetical protein JHK87_039424 [Glycine soja]KAG4962761.1 hypothetical protein JHK86_039629 [Glycine max]KAG4965229.1 hypothetical protein JHK85_040204 [Glycine max]KAG5110223.1 hypothetical protein JHK82_039446 [Glycine max]KAG5121510.1 hypothetical protein JHK84_039850 [Glycine max]